MPLRTSATRVIDVGAHRVIPGLIDSHIHFIRGGLNYNLELRWDGVKSLADAMAMLKRQVAITPPPQWVRVVGGFTEHQFIEKRLPTLEELNRVAPDTPVFILHLYDRALLNRAALQAAGFTKDTPDPPGGFVQRTSGGEPTGLLIAKPNANILYATLAKGPKLAPEFQLYSTRQFMAELNRLGVTSVIDAGGGYQNYPDDYEVVQKLARDGELTLRVAYNLFTQRAGGELADFEAWSKLVAPGQGDDTFRHNGAGEMLVFSAADFEDFREPRPKLAPTMEGQLEAVVRTLVEQRWPWRLHATYDESIGRALDVFERVSRDMPFQGLPWFFDHAETISERNIDRVAALGGGIAVQHRMMFQGEYFVQRYGEEAARRTPPLARMLAAGIPVGAGTDATRVASHNPWVSLAWLITGKTLGGTQLYPKENRVDRETALRMWTEKNSWFSSDVGNKGQLKVGQLADLAVLSADFFAVPEEEIPGIASVLTLLGGRVVHASGPFSGMAPPPPPAMPEWSPARNTAASIGQAGHTSWRGREPSAPASTLWTPSACDCWAF
jgi:predicted amidohydrolase YtcJ